MAARVGGYGGGQHPGNGGDAAIQCQFTQNGKALQRVRRNGTDRRHHAERNRQIIMAALFGHIRRGEINRDALGRERQARGIERRAHPLARFRHRLVTQPHDDKHHRAAGNLHLHVNWSCFNSLKRNRGNPHDHLPPPATQPRKASR